MTLSRRKSRNNFCPKLGLFCKQAVNADYHTQAVRNVSWGWGSSMCCLSPLLHVRLLIPGTIMRLGLIRRCFGRYVTQLQLTGSFWGDTLRCLDVVNTVARSRFCVVAFLCGLCPVPKRLCCHLENHVLSLSCASQRHNSPFMMSTEHSC